MSEGFADDVRLAVQKRADNLRQYMTSEVQPVLDTALLELVDPDRPQDAVGTLAEVLRAKGASQKYSRSPDSKPLEGDQKNLPIRAYLDAEVTSALRAAVEKCAAERPEKTAEYLASCLDVEQP